jgi:hypothetical protein
MAPRRSLALTGRLLDVFTPGPATPPVRAGAVAAAHPERAGEIRAILDKAAVPRFAVIVRYAPRGLVRGAAGHCIR